MRGSLRDSNEEYKYKMRTGIFPYTEYGRIPVVFCAAVYGVNNSIGYGKEQPPATREGFSEKEINTNKKLIKQNFV